MCFKGANRYFPQMCCEDSSRDLMLCRLVVSDVCEEFIPHILGLCGSRTAALKRWQGYQSTLRDTRQIGSLNHHIVKPKVELCYEFFDACMVAYVCIWYV